MFSDKLRAALPEPKLKATWERVRSASGSLQSMGDATFKSRGELRGVVIPVTFEKKKRSIEIVFNPAGEIAGLLID